MRKGFVHIDWVIGFGVFLIFAVLTISYFLDLSTERVVSPLDDATALFADNTMEYLLVEVYSVPVIHNSNGSVPSAVLYADLEWPFGKDTTQVLKDGSPQTCRIIGDTIYWTTSLADGNNEFNIRFSSLNQSLQCTGTFSVTGANQTIPGALERLMMVSQTKLTEMSSTPYQTFKEEVGINRDFRIEIRLDGTEINYGMEAPLTDVFVEERWGTVLETDERMSLRLMSW